MKLVLKDGTTYTFQDPKYILEGLIKGPMCQYYTNESKIIDETNNLELNIVYDPSSDKSYSGMMKRAWKWGSKKSESDEQRKFRNDDIAIQIFQRGNVDSQTKSSAQKGIEKVILATGSGSWLSHVEFEGECHWRIQDDIPQWLPSLDKTSDGMIRLPSDMNNRNDIPLIFARDWDKAEEEKAKLEQLQRHDTKLRQEAAKRKVKK